MKIYCARRNTTASEFLDKLVGKNVWVKVVWADTKFSREPQYDWVNVVSKTPEGYMAHYVEGWRVTDNSTLPCGFLFYDRVITEEYNLHLESFEIAKPIEIVSSDEFFDIQE